MLPRFFIKDLPLSISEPRLRSLLDDDRLLRVSFREIAGRAIAMVETCTPEEARLASEEFAKVRSEGGMLVIVPDDTREGRRLAEFFATSG